MSQAAGDTRRTQLDERLVVELGAAFQQRVVYPSAHPQVRRAIERAVAAFDARCAATGAGEASLILLEGQLLVDRAAVPETATWTRGLLLAFDRLGLGGMTLSTGLDADELARFLDGCAEGERPLSTRHLQIGHAGFVGSGQAEPAPAAAGVDELPGFAPADQLAAGKSELGSIGTGGATRLDHLRAMISRLARAASGARLEPPRLAVADLHDIAFLHGLGTALAAMRLAFGLGLDGDDLEEMGLAGMLHDVGHLDSTPEESAEERRFRHTVRGAARLAALEGLSELVVVVAYEHHLRFDGVPNYPRLTLPRRPVAAARLVAVADTWDTLRSRGRATPAEALAVMRDRAGTYLDPTLVELFAAIVEAEPG